MKRCLGSVLICAGLNWAWAEPQEWSSHHDPYYVVKQEDGGTCSLWRDNKAVWSGGSPSPWTDALVADDGKYVVGLSAGRIDVLGSDGHCLQELRSPPYLQAGWLTSQDAFFQSAVAQVLYRLPLESGRLSRVTKQDMPPVLAAPQTPSEVAALLAAFEGLKLPQNKLKALPKDATELSIYLARWGQPQGLRADLTKGDDLAQRWAVLLPGATLESLLKEETPDYEVIAHLGSAAQLSRARSLAKQPGPWRDKALYLLCYRGDQSAQQQVLHNCLTKKGERWLDISALTGCGSALSTQLAPLLSQPLDSLDKSYLLGHFLAHPEAQILPLLALHVNDRDLGAECQRVLREKTRMNLGADASAWKKWLAGPHQPNLRTRAQALAGEPSVPLWLGRVGTVQQARQSLAQQPRTLAVIASGPTSQLVFTGRDCIARLQGTITTPAYAWELHSKVVNRFPDHVPGGLDFGFSQDFSTCILMNSASREAAVLGKTPLQWHSTDMADTASLSPHGDCMILSQKGYPGETKLVALGQGRALWDDPIDLPMQEAPIFRPVGPSQLIAPDSQSQKLYTAPWKQAPVELGSSHLGPYGYTPDGKQYLRFQDSYGLQDIASEKFQAIPCLSSLQTSLRFHRFSPSGAYLGLQTMDEAILVNLAGDRLQNLPEKQVERMEFSPDDHTLAVNTESSVLLYSLPQVTKLAEFRSLPRTTALAFSPDSRYFAAATGSQIRVWEIHPTLTYEDTVDLALLLELWTGQRLAGGAALGLTPEQYQQRLQRWSEGTGHFWVPDPQPPSSAGRRLPMALIALVAGGLVFWWGKRRS